MLAVLVAGRVNVPIGPFDATLSAHPSASGSTVIRLAPLGTIRLDTHDAPLTVEARVNELRPDEAEAIARDPGSLDQLEADLARDARAGLVALIRRALLVALVGGALGVLLASRSWRPLVAGMTATAVMLALALGQTARTWRPEALAEPRYTGLLTIAPRAVGDIEAIVDRFDEYTAQLAELVGNLTTLYAVGQGLPAGDVAPATTRLLHVSDVHLNPAAYDLMERLIGQFGIDAVVDTGDTTDFGTEAESQLITAIGELDVPYVWVRGNHDSTDTQDAIAALPNAVVLDSDPVEVAGIRMWGFADPRYTPDKSGEVGTDVERRQAERLAPDVATALRQDQPPAVDLVALHDARLAADLGDLTPLILSGHYHEARQDRIGDALLLQEGTTGGGGLRALQGDAPQDLTATVLYLDQLDRLVAYDRITVQGLGQTGARIERHLVHHPPDSATPGTTSTTPPGPTAVDPAGGPTSTGVGAG